MNTKYKLGDTVYYPQITDKPEVTEVLIKEITFSSDIDGARYNRFFSESDLYSTIQAAKQYLKEEEELIYLKKIKAITKLVVS